MIIAQYVLVYLVSAVSYIFREPVSGKKLMAGVSQSSLTIGMLFVLAVLLYGRMPVIAAGIGITAAVMGIFMTFAAISHLFRFEKTGRLLTVILIVAVLSIFGLKYIQFACGDIYRILLNILNI